jgi:hypothetical protein
MNAYRAMMRRRLLERIYDKMSDEERRTFVQLTMQDKDHKEIMASLNELKQRAESNHHSFVSDFGANIAGNAAWDGLLWIGSKLLRRL